jgi:hypothetical protein
MMKKKKKKSKNKKTCQMVKSKIFLLGIQISYTV